MLLWIKYVWLFVLLRKNPDEYLAEHAQREFDGLRDRGWFAEYLADKNNPVPAGVVHFSFGLVLVYVLGYKVLVSVGVGIVF